MLLEQPASAPDLGRIGVLPASLRRCMPRAWPSFSVRGRRCLARACLTAVASSMSLGAVGSRGDVVGCNSAPSSWLVGGVLAFEDYRLSGRPGLLYLLTEVHNPVIDTTTRASRCRIREKNSTELQTCQACSKHAFSALSHPSIFSTSRHRTQWSSIRIVTDTRQQAHVTLAQRQPRGQPVRPSMASCQQIKATKRGLL